MTPHVNLQTLIPIMNKQSLITALFAVGTVMTLTGAAVYITGWAPAPYVYTLGASLFSLAQFNSPFPTPAPSLRRLRRQQLLGAILLVLAGALMFLTQRNEWIVCLSIAAVLQLYTALRIPQEEEKARRS